jgi:hypothetical protein
MCAQKPKATKVRAQPMIETGTNPMPKGRNQRTVVISTSDAVALSAGHLMAGNGVSATRVAPELSRVQGAFYGLLGKDEAVGRFQHSVRRGLAGGSDGQNRRRTWKPTTHRSSLKVEFFPLQKRLK